MCEDIPRPEPPFKSRVVPVEISLGCSDLPTLQATQSAITIFAVVWIRRAGGDGRWQEHGRTEPVRHGSTPQFARSFFFEYLDHNDNLRADDYDTSLRIEIYQHTNANATTDLASQKCCGYCDTTLRVLHRTPVKRLELPLRLSSQRVISRGSVHVRIADAPPSTQLQPFVEIDIAATEVFREKGGTGQFFATCHRYTTGGVFELVYRTELARPCTTGSSSKTANGLRFRTWKPTLHRCCFQNVDSRLLFEFVREDKLGFHESVGRAETSLAELLDAAAAPSDPNPARPASAHRKQQLSGAKLVLSPSPHTPAALLADCGMSATTLVIHAELFSSSPTTPVEPRSLAHDEEISADHGGRSSKSSSASKSGGVRRKAAGGKSKGKGKDKQAVAATASREFGDDLKFLQELAGDRLVKATDIKDIVGDGVRYLHERHRRNQKKGMSGGGVVTASSGYRRHGRTGAFPYNP